MIKLHITKFSWRNCRIRIKTIIMKNFNRLVLFVTSIMLIQLLSSCNSQKVLNADFEDDELNAYPTLDLPGDPTGDLIQWFGNPGEFLRVLSWTDDNNETNNWLSFNQNSSDPNFYPGILSFIPVATSIQNSLYTFTWVGRIDGPPPSSFLDIHLTITENSSHGSDQVLSLVLKPQSFVTGESSRRFGVYMSEGGTLSSEPLGIIRSGRAHSFVITISEEDREYTIAGVGPAFTGSFSSEINLNRPTLSCIFSGFPGNGSYLFNYVGIHESDR